MILKTILKMNHNTNYPDFKDEENLQSPLIHNNIQPNSNTMQFNQYSQYNNYLNLQNQILINQNNLKNHQNNTLNTNNQINNNNFNNQNQNNFPNLNNNNYNKNLLPNNYNKNNYIQNYEVIPQNINSRNIVNNRKPIINIRINENNQNSKSVYYNNLNSLPKHSINVICPSCCFHGYSYVKKEKKFSDESFICLVLLILIFFPFSLFCAVFLCLEKKKGFNHFCNSCGDLIGRSKRD